jgi:outer membrane lipoprotein-sorting protein
MSRRYIISFAVAALVVAGVVGVAASRAQGGTTLPSISPAALLAKVADAAKSPIPVSGDVAWTNGLIPGSDLTGLLGGQGSAPSSLAGLAMGGSGRLWVQPGSGVRLDVQGSGSDFVLVGGKSGVWAYSSATGTAVRYALPAGMATSAPRPAASAVDPLAAITNGLQRFAATGTVAVTGDQTVAGRQSYVLTITPAAGTTTTLGSVRVAVDGATYVPLQVQVFAKGDTTPTLSAGFTSVSYAANGASLFSFTPPAGATVQHKTLPSMTPAAGGGLTTDPTPTHHAPLTLARAQAKAKSYGLTLAAASTASLPFEGATVVPGKGGNGATAVLHYGRGFGSVVLAESTGAAGTTGATGGVMQQLAKLPQGLLAKTTVGGAQAHELSTSLVDAIVWQRGQVTLVAGGMVPSATLQQFVAGIR